jgi:hypothetical protein
MTKSRSLPLTELANLFGKPDSEQYQRLKEFVKPVGFKIPSYSLSKACAPEVFGVSGPMLPLERGLRGARLFEFVSRMAKGNGHDRDFNWPVIQALADWSDSENVIARARKFDPVSLTGVHRKALVCNGTPLWRDRFTMVVLDPRREGYLTAHGAYVVQCIGHHLIRDQHLDVADTEIAVMYFFETGEPLKLPPGCKPAVEGMQMTKRRLFVSALGDREIVPAGDIRNGLAKTLGIFDMVVAEARGVKKAS